MTQQHTPIGNGGGWRCSTCGVAWDLGDEPGACEPTVEMNFESPATVTLSVGGYGAPAPRDPHTYQIGGGHYSKLGIQPREFAMQNRWDCDLFSALKYLTRWRDKGGAADLRKARHFVEFRAISVASGDSWPPSSVISMSQYIFSNGIDNGVEVAALMALESWAFQRTDGRLLLQKIDILIADADRVEAHEKRSTGTTVSA